MKKSFDGLLDLKDSVIQKIRAFTKTEKDSWSDKVFYNGSKINELIEPDYIKLSEAIDHLPLVVKEVEIDKDSYLKKVEEMKKQAEEQN